jgi:hypothetical protein
MSSFQSEQPSQSGSNTTMNAIRTYLQNLPQLTEVKRVAIHELAGSGAALSGAYLLTKPATFTRLVGHHTRS